MRITYDTVSDSVSSDELAPEQNQQLQSALSSALAKNLPVREVAASLMSLAGTLAAD